MTEPATKLDTRFSQPGSFATTWTDTQRVVESAELFWITTVRADGRPHVSPWSRYGLTTRSTFPPAARNKRP